MALARDKHSVIPLVSVSGLISGKSLIFCQAQTLICQVEEMVSSSSWMILRVRGGDARKTTGSACSLDAAAAGSERWVRPMGRGQTTEPLGQAAEAGLSPGREGRAQEGK